MIFKRIYRGLILYNLRIRTFKLISLSKREKLRNKHLLLISILDNSPLLSHDNNLPYSYSKRLFEFLFIKDLQSYTTYTRF